MPDEQVTEQEPTQEVEPSVEPEAEKKPHPLEPGGDRFKQVYGQMMDTKRENADLRERVARMEGQLSAQTQPQQQQKWYTAQELQRLVDEGRIPPALASDQLAWQRKEEAKREVMAEYQKTQTQKAAQSEIAEYVSKIPALRDSSSDGFTRVARAAREIADELGRSVDDPVVTRRALRETYGTLDRLVQSQRNREFSRQNADTHAEIQRGGGGGEAPAKDPVADIPAMYREHWKRLGYSPERMKQEAELLRNRPYRWRR